MNSRTKVAIIEPSDIIRIGVEHIVVSDPSFAITHSEEALPAEAKAEVEIAIVNIALMTPVEIKRIEALFPAARIIALTYSYSSREQRALCSEVIEVMDSPERILELLSQGIESKERGAQKGESGELSERECEIVAAVARGLINKEIADTLNISIHTVMAHRKNISRKTGIRSISGLVVYALLNGLISESEVIK